MDAEKIPTNSRPTLTRWQQLRGVLHQVLELVRKPPHLTTAAALIGVTVLVVLVWLHAAAYARDTTQNSTLAYHLALSGGAQADFLHGFFAKHWRLGAWCLFPALVLAVIRLRGRMLTLPLVLMSLAFLVLWLVNDIHDNWDAAHFGTMGEIPSPWAYYVKLVIISAAWMSLPVLYTLYHRSSILDQYLVRNFLAPFMLCLMAIIAIKITMDLLDHANDFLKANFTPLMVGQFYMRQIPEILVMIMDAAVLLATLYTLSAMSRRNEIISMLGAGLSLVRILLPLLVIGAAASLIVLAMNYEWAPSAQGAKETMLRLADKGDGRGAQKNRREAASAYNVMFRNREEHRTWYLWRVPNNLSLTGPKIDFAVIIQDDGNGNMLKTWYAKRASWFPGINKWRLYDAHIIDAAVMANPPPPPAQTIPSYEKLMIDEPWSETPWTVLSGKINSEFLSVPELAAYLNSSVSLEEKKLWRYQTTLHARLSLPFRCFLMILLAAPLGIVTARRGVLGGVAMAVGLFVLVYFTYTIGLRMGEGGHLSPALGAWGVLGIFSIFGVVMLYMKNFGLTMPSLSNWWVRRRRLAAQKLKSV